jgi:TRAP-type C4-dicarboxylate transport system permease small subunit
VLKVLGAIDRSIEKGASWILVACVIGMLVLSLLIIVLRWFALSLAWAEPFVRHLVFLSAFMGGVLATGRGTHIGIDIIGKILEAQGNTRAHVWVLRAIQLTSFLTLSWLITASWDFVLVEAQYGKAAFLGIHSKFLVAIIPFGLALISYRFLYLLLSSFSAKENLQEAK